MAPLPHVGGIDLRPQAPPFVHCEPSSAAVVMGDAEAICKKISALKQQACFILAVRFPLETFRRID
jgi:hypothetical protein